MHELGITRSIVSIVEEAANGRRVRRVTLDVGRLAGVIPEALSFCFDVVSKGTVLDGARLDIREIAGRCRCLDCSAEFETSTLYQACGCGSRHLERLAGEELKIREMELEEAA
ncbi:hydrogenase maturation nickel metallochaperone HypA [Mesorhizobium sp. VK25A]|uniref:Hydrogenase maturation factor HypA n=1 Tax=Mesorhizobium vachelliae TaxID=3072309 RepID=A0ABU5A612_9HYPH|nr:MULTISPECIES: hydrogenase maturation nickel metallochaperone HypA [unclassified Mesorhizobium]MDX8533123.1 hydrogenase maturation nickel metallochaperone HypA [Mesorhizobium sp. VK25D]MDX8545042.1 hydrogenase maturation nickel metallochaperone HypA [Mesorhizobium sp. VK25A]